jgi:hypothetical protein
VDTVKQMINFLYTHTYYDSTQAGPDDISLFEANSQQEVELPIQHLELQANAHQTTSQIVPKADEETDEVMRATALKSLLFHIKINSIADYYDIPELRRCANTKVQNVLNTSWSPCNFPVILQEAFNSSGDKELRNILSEAMAAHIDELVELGEEIAPSEAISDFAYDVLHRLVARIKNLESQLEHANDYDYDYHYDYHYRYDYNYRYDYHYDYHSDYDYDYDYFNGFHTLS